MNKYLEQAKNFLNKANMCENNIVVPYFPPMKYPFLNYDKC